MRAAPTLRYADLMKKATTTTVNFEGDTLKQSEAHFELEARNRVTKVDNYSTIVEDQKTGETQLQYYNENDKLD